MEGQRFNKLTVLHRAVRHKHGGLRWVCRCDCGAIKEVGQTALQSGATGTCGRKGCKRTCKGTHNQCTTNLYKIWSGMRQRCSNPRATNYARYGGVGIRVCERWDKFENFAADMGDRPSAGHTLDRINGTKNYTPENTRWADILRQQKNIKSNVYYEHQGERLHLSEWARRAGMPSVTLSHRLLAGIDFERAIDPTKMPKRSKVRERLLTCRGKTQNLRAWAREVGITSVTIGRRLDRGCSAEDALDPTPRNGRPWVKN